MTDAVPTLPELLALHRERLSRWVRNRASGLLAYESEDDVVQDIHARALAVEARFEWRGEDEFLGWLLRVAMQHVSNRHAYWTAQRRRAGVLLRASADLARSGPLAPATPTRGPATRAERREALSIAARALSLLADRDAELVRWMSEDVALDVVAARLGVSYAAAERARLRAVERFRRAYAEIERRGPGPAAGGAT